eukprot:CAMPEP_0182455352 /NCGR_PEP_ID=MMETSP1319-20130603/1556_1 /TAXON_ID=172717 /ORGANISM="Bolidomonas pacifica, Strain RCC208" /LENGTH=272 /DNA_ID=CAMNT_0024653399 /DNA_START=152 /DNA_END=967 /DNA_ORIENTATION=-
MAAFALKTGRPLVQMAFPGVTSASVPAQVYTDFNQDGIPEVTTVDHHSRLDIKTARPPQTSLFDASVGASRDSRHQRQSPEVDAFTMAEAGSVYVATSDGVVSRVDYPPGKKRWTCTRGAAWQPQPNDQNPAMVRVASYSPTHLVVAGAMEVVLISKASGRECGRLRLPQALTGTPQVADFDDDGTPDLIVGTPDAVWGYRVSHTASWRPLNIIVLALMTLMALMVFVAETGMADDAEGGGKRAHAQPVFTVRSTDIDEYEERLIRRRRKRG